MANRIATHILKNSNILSRPLPSTLFKGEPIVNTADGIVYFSGTSASSPGWTPAGASTTYFEVGSNLYDLQLRNRITKYEGLSGASLVGKFLSGTTNGFTLADISAISGVDTYVTGFTYSNNVATIKQNLGRPDLSILINTMTGLTVTGTISAITSNATTSNVNTVNATGGTITTLSSTTANITTLTATGGTITTLGSTTATLGTANITTLNATGGTVTTLGSTTATLGTANITTENVNTLNATGATITTLGSTTANITTLNATGGTITTLSATTLNLGNIASYSGLTNLSGYFLSGTTSGFVLAPTSGITGIDTYTTGFTYSNNVATIKRNLGQPDLSILINTMTGLTVNGLLSATTIAVSGGTLNAGAYTGPYSDGTVVDYVTGNGRISVGTGDAISFYTGGVGASPILTVSPSGLLSGLTSTFATGTLGTANITTLNATGGTVTTLGSTTATLGTANITTENVNTLNATGGTITTLGSTTANLGTANVTTLNATGGTITTLGATTLNLGNIASYSGLTNLAGQFLSGTTSGFALAPISAITGIDTYVTGFTYSPTTNTITLAQNQGQAAKTVTISTVSGLTVSDLTANRVVYTTTSGKLITGTAQFDGTNMILPAAGSLSIGTGGLTVGAGGAPGVPGTGDVVINGNLTVFGDSVSAFTSQLYVEDNNVTLNYNPTGSTTSTSIGAGWTIQDGNGVTSGSVNFDVRAMNTFTGITSTNIPSISEYGGSTGYANRAWVTQLNDVVIRSTNVTTPNGVRVLAEFDILDGGQY